VELRWQDNNTGISIRAADCLRVAADGVAAEREKVPVVNAGDETATRQGKL
jgi:hypothetical protein